MTDGISPLITGNPNSSFRPINSVKLMYKYNIYSSNTVIHGLVRDTLTTLSEFPFTLAC